MECEQLPKLLYTGMRGLVVLGRIVLGLVILLPNKGIGRPVGVEGDANVLRSV